MRTLILCFSLLFALLTQPAWAIFGNNAGNNTGTASFAPTQNRFVPVDEAFPFNAFQQGSTLFIDWQVKEDITSIKTGSASVVKILRSVSTH